MRGAVDPLIRHRLIATVTHQVSSHSLSAFHEPNRRARQSIALDALDRFSIFPWSGLGMASALWA
jgi:hypothetical protein